MSAADSTPRVGPFGALFMTLFLAATIVAVVTWVTTGNYGPFVLAFPLFLITCRIAGRGGRDGVAR